LGVVETAQQNQDKNKQRREESKEEDMKERTKTSKDFSYAAN
jgi:hypothetical protein